MTIYDGDKEQILSSIVSLGDNPEHEDVDRVIGNDSWTTITCTICRSHPEEGVLLPEPLGEGGDLVICRGCIKKLLDTLTVSL